MAPWPVPCADALADDVGGSWQQLRELVLVPNGRGTRIGRGAWPTLPLPPGYSLFIHHFGERPIVDFKIFIVFGVIAASHHA